MGFVITIDSKEKTDAAKEFRTKIVLEYEKWYNEEIDSLYGEKAPSDSEKIKVGNIRENSILTWTEVHQKKKYLKELHLDKDVFSHQRILDIGSGGIPSALVFEQCEIFCLDPLMDTFRELCYPFRFFDERAHFINGLAETMPFPDKSFDAIISVNAIDHLDDLQKVSSEIMRVLKTNGRIRFHVHYHESTILEPIELNDELMKSLFYWCNGFKKVHESSDNYYFMNASEKYVVWSNF